MSWPPFKGFGGVTQGNLLLPTILNVVIEAIMHHCVTLVVEEEAGMKGLGALIQILVTYLYSNDSLIVSTWAGRIK